MRNPQEYFYVRDHKAFKGAQGEDDTLEVELDDCIFYGKNAWHDAAIMLGFRFDKPSGWKGRKRDDKSVYYTNNTKFGVKYMCKLCGKKQLGIGGYNHWPWCHANRKQGE